MDGPDGRFIPLTRLAVSDLPRLGTNPAFFRALRRNLLAGECLEVSWSLQTSRHPCDNRRYHPTFRCCLYRPYTETDTVPGP
ncbi:hypothetical protein MRX96_038571 [Rhipicephalus microplus]